MPKMPKMPDLIKDRSVKTTFETLKPSGPGIGMGEKAGSETIAQKSGAVGRNRPPVEHQFKPGNCANPGGKPVGSRNRLQGDFLRELSADFELHGKSAIIECRMTKPDVYVRMIASLMPKELEITRPLDGLNEEELIAAVAALQSFVSSQGIGSGISVAPVSQSTH